MKIGQIILIIAVSAGLAIGVQQLLQPQTEDIKAAVSAYDRVKATSTIRCGYALWAGMVEKDPNTGVLSGLFYDYANAAAKKLSLKIDWAVEMGLGDMVPALQSGRIDAYCGGAWPNAARAREIDFTAPAYYNSVFAYVRANDDRFDGNIARLNNGDYKVAYGDGETSSVIKQADFPLAQSVALPAMSSEAEILETVASGKADITLADPAVVGAYMAGNPGKLKMVANVQALRTFPVTLAINSGEYKLKRMLDIVTEELINEGTMEKLIAKHEKYPGSYLRVREGFKSE